MKYIVVVLLFITEIYAQKLLQVSSVYEVSSGVVTDIAYAPKSKRLYIATDSGKIEVFDTNSTKKMVEITLSKIKDFMGDEVPSKILSLDIWKTKRLLVLSQDSDGYSRMHLYEEGKLHTIISKKEKLNIIKAKFLDKENIIVA